MTTSPIRLAAAAFALAAAASAAQAQTPNGAPSRPAPSTPSSSAVAADYRLTPGDKLRVEVYKDAQLSQSLQVWPDGKVTLPLLGDIVATDLTPIQLRDRIAESLKEYITNPVVTVIVVEASPVMVYVMGEVSQPGSIPMRGQMTVLQALAMAGGFKEFANTKNIRILRRGASGIETIRFNYKEAVESGKRPVVLQAGDTVVVP
jgi:polysaccharide export outer membrane protein